MYLRIPSTLLVIVTGMHEPNDLHPIRGEKKRYEMRDGQEEEKNYGIRKSVKNTERR